MKKIGKILIKYVIKGQRVGLTILAPRRVSHKEDIYSNGTVYMIGDLVILITPENKHLKLDMVLKIIVTKDCKSTYKVIEVLTTNKGE
ncbi:hypothetical protein KAR91_24685 [Candidatus Pacearchaeota archaeon]|nr:hypothetical protein [Candidatus Pacearchaeota archaeon]